MESADKHKVALPGCDFGPHLMFVGNYGEPDLTAEGDSNGDRRRRLLNTAWCPKRGWWVEVVPASQQLLPRDLYSAMVARRKRTPA